MRRAVASAICAALMVAPVACARGEAVPKALREHLEALRSDAYDDAFELTQLDDDPAFFSIPGASLSRAHFSAFFRANPLESYDVLEVVRLEQRSIEAPAERGSARFEVTARLRFRDGSSVRQHYSVIGEVVPTVELEPTSITLRDARGALTGNSVLVDGVRSTISVRDDAPFQGVFSLLVLQGRHRLTVAGADVEISTEPLRVLTGAARVVDGPGGGKLLEIG